MVVAAEDVREGIRRLLEEEGDIRVVSLRSLLGDGLPPGAVIVLGPGVRVGLADWETMLDGRGVVVLVALPGWRTYPKSVSQVPMELTGDGLRRAVREQAGRGAPAPVAAGVFSPRRPGSR